ncbi:UNVERIFIED_CONTAM: Signal peptide peptidase [Sesamum calycinum]|uniref:Signal peptide peptidase n=1 Tax=Sesamum calycinum TaxID=2727403 RepID=A0AAW2SDX3_9LAMI
MVSGVLVEKLRAGLANFLQWRNGRLTAIDELRVTELSFFSQQTDFYEVGNFNPNSENSFQTRPIWGCHFLDLGQLKLVLVGSGTGSVSSFEGSWKDRVLMYLLIFIILYLDFGCDSCSCFGEILRTVQNFSRFRMKNHERLANLALAGLTIAPTLREDRPKFKCHPDSFSNCETMSNEHAMRFPLVGSAMLLSLFFLFKFLSKDLVNAVLTCYFFVLGIAALSATLLPAIKRFLPKPWNDNPIIWHFPYFRSLEVEFTKSQIVAAIPGTFFCIWYASKKHWLANNILGLAFCIQGIEMLSLGSFKTGAILLAGLFVYDIFWVFFTPVMVSVAKSFDAPIKLLFPTSDSARPFSMLGLGDIVIPEEKSQYFKSAFVGYTVGLVVTIIVMNWFQAAQPALLYIVPGVIGFLAAHCLWNGEVKPLLAFDESKTSSASEETDADSSKKAD